MGKIFWAAVLFTFIQSELFAQCSTSANQIRNNDVTIPASDNCTVGNLGRIITGQRSGNTLDINGSLTVNGGFFIYGTVIVNNVLNVNGDLRILVGGQLIINTGAAVNIDGNVINGGNFTTGSSSIDGIMNVTGNFTNSPQGTLDGNGILVVDGNFTNNGTLGPDFIGCGGGAGCGAGFLPVELVSFEAHEDFGEAVLTWATIEEVNNEGFYVEKSSNGHDFTSIGFVEGNATTSIRQEYEFVDEQFTSTAYYRLKQVDFDGGYEYHEIIILNKTEIGGINLSLYPNPVVNAVHLSGDLNDTYNYTIYNSEGYRIKEGAQLQGNDFKVEIEQNILNLNRGQYLIAIEGTSTEQQMLRLMKN